MSATPKMIEYARGIADMLDIPEPDYSNFSEVQNFIGINKLKYQEMCKITFEKQENESSIISYRRIATDNGYNPYAIDIIIEAVANLENEHGVYLFWSNDKLVYVGKSMNLKNRVVSSFVDRSRSIEITDFNMILCEREADAHILEILLIIENKPLLNIDCKCKDYSKYITTKLYGDNFDIRAGLIELRGVIK